MNLASIVQDDDHNLVRKNLGIVIKCYTEIGSISVLGKISVDAREIINIDAQTVTHFVVVQVETAGDYPQQGTAIIGYDDIENICSAIDKLKLVDPKASKFSLMEAEYNISDIKIIVFNTSKSKMMGSISASGSSAHFDLTRIDEFKNLLIKAKAVIDSCKSSRF